MSIKRKPQGYRRKLPALPSLYQHRLEPKGDLVVQVTGTSKAGVSYCAALVFRMSTRARPGQPSLRTWRVDEAAPILAHLRGQTARDVKEQLGSGLPAFSR